MTNNIFFALISVIVISLVSLVGILALSIRMDLLKKILTYLVSFSTGTMFAGAFFHLIPEAVEKIGFGFKMSSYLMSGILVSFVMEKIIHWRHCHNPQHMDQHVHSFAYMNLIGDCVHNFIDGLIIGGAYLVSIPTGLATTIAVFWHEIPQEIGDFGVLLQGGFKRNKAIFYNFLTALTAVIGTVIILIVGPHYENLLSFLLPFAAGNFIYIAGSDLIPELHKETSLKKNLIQFIFLFLGVLLIVLMGFLEI